MRIVCPSCNAQYEIDVSLLPDGGREVQCSACGHIWFQSGAASATDTTSAPEPSPSPAAPELNTPTDQTSPNTASPETDSASQTDEPDLTPEEDTALEGDDDQPRTVPQPQAVDAKVLDILRDEAEYEAQQRAREATGLETQPELGLLGAAPWPSKPERAEDEDTRASAGKAKTAAPAFPDIDDISESLEPVGRKRDKNSAFEVPATGEEKKRSFLRGMMLPVILALILVSLYLAAPAIIDAIPASAPILTGYVNTIDELRNAITGLLGS